MKTTAGQKFELILARDIAVGDEIQCAGNIATITDVEHLVTVTRASHRNGTIVARPQHLVFKLIDLSTEKQ